MNASSMGEFAICLSDKGCLSDGGSSVLLGFMKLGEQVDYFRSSLSYWDREAYLSQWKDALGHLVRGKSRSALVTDMIGPNNADYIVWWPLYLIGDKVHIQSHVLFFDQLERAFDEGSLYEFVPPRRTQTEDGQRISEWVVGISAIRACFESFSAATLSACFAAKHDSAMQNA